MVELYGTLHNGADWSLQSYPNYKDYRDRSTSFSGLFVYRVVVASLAGRQSMIAEVSKEMDSVLSFS